jgi:Zn-dependent protease
MLLSLLFSQPLTFVLIAVALVLSLSFHEAAHAFVADRLGDPTAKMLGRLTLNPLAHLDPMGTFLLLFAGIGWGKPVPFNPTYLKNPKRDSALISFAGPFSNFLLAIIFAILFKLVGTTGIVGTFLYFMVLYNLLLGFFNLIPLHPLDGFKVVNGFLPESLSYQWLQIAPYGIWILLLLVLTNTSGRFLNFFVTFGLNLLGVSRF